MLCQASAENRDEDNIGEKKKNSWACFDLGQLYEMGVGVEQNWAKAVESYETPCGDDHWRACDRLALIISQGVKGVPADPERAIELLERGCDGGHGKSCVHAGAAYQHARRPKRAFEYVYTRARACVCIYCVYKFSFALHFRLFERGCNIGHTHSCHNYALFLSMG